MSRRRPSVSTVLRSKILPDLRYLVAVSGGMDSISLLHALQAIRRLKRIEIEVAHVDHKVRVESEDDRRFVQNMAAELELPFHYRELGACPAGTNFEAWAREQRYSFFDELVPVRQIDWVLTAHTASDVTETLLMRLVSNKEASGIAEIDPGRRLFRPLLGISRASVEEYVALNSLTFRHDSTNDDTSYLRSRVRALLLPFLKEHFGESSIDSLGERAVRLTEDEKFLSGLARKQADKVLLLPWGTPEFVDRALTEIGGIESAIEWRFAEELLRPVVNYGVGHRQALEFVRFLRAGRGRLRLAGGAAFEWQERAVRRVDELFVSSIGAE